MDATLKKELADIYQRIEQLKVTALARVENWHKHLPYADENNALGDYRLLHDLALSFRAIVSDSLEVKNNGRRK